MDISDLLIGKKKELLANMDNNSNPIVMAYALGAYNLCDELLRNINDNINISKPTKKQSKYAICEVEKGGYNIVSGDKDEVFKCIQYIEECLEEGHYATVINSARKKFSSLKWEFALDYKTEVQNAGVEFLIVAGGGGFPIKEDICDN